MHPMNFSSISADPIFIFFQVNMLQHLLCDQFVLEQDQHNMEGLQTLPKLHHPPMWKRSKNQSTIAHLAIWEQLSLYYRLFWLFYVCYLPFTCIIIMEVVSNSSCIGISSIKNRRRITCQYLNQFQLLLQTIPLQRSTHQYHLHEQNGYRKHWMKLLPLNQALSAGTPDKAVITSF